LFATWRLLRFAVNTSQLNIAGSEQSLCLAKVTVAGIATKALAHAAKDALWVGEQKRRISQPEKV